MEEQPSHTPGLEQWRDPISPSSPPEAEKQREEQPSHTPGLEQWRDISPPPSSGVEQRGEEQPSHTAGFEEQRDVPTQPPSSDRHPSYTPGLEQWRDNLPADPPSEAEQQSNEQPTPLAPGGDPSQGYPGADEDKQMEQEGEERQTDSAEEQDTRPEPPPSPEVESDDSRNEEQKESEPSPPHFHFWNDASRGFSFEEGEMECPPCVSLILLQAAALLPNSVAEWLITLVCVFLQDLTYLLHHALPSLPPSLPRDLMLALLQYWPQPLLFSYLFVCRVASQGDR